MLRDLNGEFWLTMSIPRPADLAADNGYDKNTWLPYAGPLGVATEPEVHDIWMRYMGVALPADRAAIWTTRLAPAIARRLVDDIRVELFQDGVGFAAPLPLDVTLVSRFQQGAPMLVSFRASGAPPGLTRAQVGSVRFRFGSLAVPAQVETMVQSGSLRYRTDHLARAFFDDQRIQNDLSQSDFVTMATPLDRMEKNNPRQTDRKLSRVLIDILNERLEYFHRIIWLTMDPNRRYLFLDGIVAPDTGGRSVASVVDNRVIGIVGQFPGDAGGARPSARSDLPIRATHAKGPEASLRGRPFPADAHQHADPRRVRRSRHGAVQQLREDRRQALLALGRRADPRFANTNSAAVDCEPAPGAAFGAAGGLRRPDGPHAGHAPAAPDPTGLSAALSLLGTKDLFRNLTGLALNQENAAAALKSVMSAAQSFASQGAALAQQKFLSTQMDRNLDLIKQARDRKQITPDQAQGMSESMFRGALRRAPS